MAFSFSSASKEVDRKGRSSLLTVLGSNPSEIRYQHLPCNLIELDHLGLDELLRGESDELIPFVSELRVVGSHVVRHAVVERVLLHSD